MQQVPADIWAAFERRLDQAQVPADQRPDYHKWVRFYCDFCHKYGHSPAAPTSLGPFLTKLASKDQAVGQRSQASAAVRLLIQAVQEPVATPRPLPATPAPSPGSILNGQPSASARPCERGPIHCHPQRRGRPSRHRRRPRNGGLLLIGIWFLARPLVLGAARVIHVCSIPRLGS
jgi:hypothetical protein